MQELITFLLNKDEKARPRIIDIIRRPFVKEHMERFVQSRGKINVTQHVSKKRSIQPEAAYEFNQLKQQDISTLTAKDRLRLQKEAKYQMEFEVMKQAAKENANQGKKAHAMRYD